MNIAIFSDTYSPQVNGVVTVINILKDGLTRRGHKVYIYTVSHPEAIEEPNVYRMKSVKFLKEPQHRMALFPNPKWYSLLKSQNIDVIHSHSPFALGHLAIMNAKLLKKAALLHTFHTYYEEYRHYLGPFKVLFTNKMIRLIGKNFCNLHDAIIAPSEKIKVHIEKHYKVKVPVELVPNGIVLEPFTKKYESALEVLRQKYNIKSSDKVIIFVGRMAKEKSVDKLLENFYKVVKKIETAKLLLVGDGPDRKKYEEIARELGISKHVIFTGYVKWPDEVAMLYKISHVFASASHTEVHPVTFIEAAASGLPLVGYRDLSIKGVLVDGVNGFSFENKDDLYIGIIKLLENDKMREEFSKNSMEISKNYDSEKFIEKMIEVYEFYSRLKKLLKSAS